MLNVAQLNTLNEIHSQVAMLDKAIEKAHEDRAKAEEEDFFSCEFENAVKHLNSLIEQKEELRKLTLSIMGF